MNETRRLCRWLGLFMLGLMPAQLCAQDLALQVGELLVLPGGQVERVAVGDGDIVHAVTTDAR